MSDRKIYIITTTNEINTYYSFLPTSYLAWKKIFPNCVYVLGIITPKSEDSFFVKRCKELSDVSYVFDNLPNIESGVQARATRMYLSTLFGDEMCIIIDIEYYLLNTQFLMDKIYPALEEDKFVSIGNNGYVGDDGKFPMCLTTAKSNIFKNIINPGNLTYEKWFISFGDKPDFIDGKESVYKKFDIFCDESLLRYILFKHLDQEYIKNKWVKQDRDDLNKHQKALLRIDRSWWKQSYDEFKLKNNYYIDVQPLRPFDENIDKLIPILKTIGINTEDKNIFFKKTIIKRCRKN